ncbi:MAG: aminotransferase, partial [Clostridiales bacterium]|nr:aminotransferase [Clostridiales bacterium]
MIQYQQMSSAERERELNLVLNLYKEFRAQDLNLDMSRGKPSIEQLALSMPML